MPVVLAMRSTQAPLLTVLFFAVLLTVHANLRRARRRIALRRRVRDACERGEAPSGGWFGEVDLESGALTGADLPMVSLQYASAATRGETVLDRVRARASAGGGWLDLPTPGATDAPHHAAYVCAVDARTASIAGHAEAE
tara:strand:- start:56 stop:475 length:420 start_codon:yes stop_codon:yes gene_type:complete